MYGVVVLIDKKVQTLLDFRKAGELLQVGNRQPFVTQRAKPPFNFRFLVNHQIIPESATYESVTADIFRIIVNMLYLLLLLSLIIA